MSKKLLLADDSVTIQKVVELILADEDFEIRSANNGDEAWSLVKEFMPDVVLADIEMPSTNGYQLCEKIKNDDSTKHIPVILLAGAFEPLDEELAAKVGADDHLVKPFESQELISKLNAIFAEKEITTAPETEVTEEAVEVSPEETAEPVEVAEAVEVEGEEEAVEVLETETPAEELSFESTDSDAWNLEEELSFEEPATSETLSTEAPAEETETFEEEKPQMEEEQPSMGIEEEISIEQPPAEEPEPTTEEPSAPAEAPPISAPEDMERIIRESAVSSINTALSGINSDMVREVISDHIKERLNSELSGIDIKGLIEDQIKAKIESAISGSLGEEIASKVEETIRSSMEDALSSLKQDVEKVIWETVPDLAETIITREIEKIKSEF
ncbi:MAG: response regulator [Nitrospirae bacterium]|nr:MAG: response regulator [Nitrospirota bacterium]